MTRGLALLCCAGLFGCQVDPGGSGGGIPPGTDGGAPFSQGLVFVRRSDRNLYLADQRDFSAATALTQGGGAHQPCLGRDGKKVVFVSGSGATSELHTVPVAGGAESVVFAADAQRANFRTPVLAPDAGFVVFAYDRAGVGYLGRVNLDSTGFVELTQTGRSYTAPSFYPDGQTVLAAAGPSPSSYLTLERVDVTTGAAWVVLANLGNEAMNIAHRAQVSADGTRAAFDARINSSATRIFLADLARSSGNVTQVTFNDPANLSASDSYPSWVDANTLGYVSDSGGSEQVYEIAAATVKGAGRLTVPAASEPWFGP